MEITWSEVGVEGQEGMACSTLPPADKPVEGKRSGGGEQVHMQRNGIGAWVNGGRTTRRHGSSYLATSQCSLGGSHERAEGIA